MGAPQGKQLELCAQLWAAGCAVSGNNAAAASHGAACVMRRCAPPRSYSVACARLPDDHGQVAAAQVQVLTLGGVRDVELEAQVCRLHLKRHDTGGEGEGGVS